MEKVSMTRRRVLEFHESLGQLAGTKLRTKAGYAIAKTRAGLKAEVDAVEKAREPNQDYQMERIALCREMAAKDGKGNPVILGNNYAIDPEKKEDFEADLSKLQHKYKETPEAVAQRQKEVDELLEEDVEIEVHKLSLDELPEEMPAGQVEALLPMLAD